MAAMGIRELDSRNRLLAALPGVEFERLRGDLETVSLPLGSSVYESGAQMH